MLGEFVLHHGEGEPRATQLRVGVLSPRDLASFGAGRYRATVSFAAPAVGADDTAVLELTVPALGAAPEL